MAKKLDPPYPMTCKNCEHEWFTRARASSSIRCPGCGKTRRVPANRPTTSIEFLDEPEYEDSTPDSHPKRARETAPLSQLAIERAEFRSERERLADAGLSASEITAVLNKRKKQADEQNTGKSLVDVARELRHAFDITVPQSAPGTALGKCQAQGCNRDASESLTSADRQTTIRTCHVHLTQASVALGKVSGYPRSARKTAPVSGSLCQSTGCTERATARVVQHSGAVGGVLTSLQVCLWHTDPARDLLSSDEHGVSVQSMPV